MNISAPHFDFIDRLRVEHDTDPALRALRDKITADQRGAPWSLVDDMVAFAGRLYIPPTSPLLQEVLSAVHNDGHEGVQRTLHRLHRDFHSPTSAPPSRTSSGHAPSASGTNPSTFTRPACSCPFLYQPQCGRMWGSTSSRRCHA
jgi:hypothetical protein